MVLPMGNDTVVNRSNDDAEFDEFAEGYDEALNRGLGLTGEGKEFFIGGRLAWLKRKLEASSVKPASCLDFGCGTGTTASYFRSILEVDTVVGIDPSDASLSVARKEIPHSWARYENSTGFTEENAFDLAYCNGVFHHIPVDEREAAVAQVFRALKPGGHFAFWENNPWNPMTRFIMSRVPFDRDAILVWPAQARRLLRDAGFEIVCTDFRFVFPKSLARLRPLEDYCRALPLGGQYQILGRKPLV